MADTQFKVSGKSTLFIDDVQHNVDAAEAHGWTGIRFENPQQLRQHLVAARRL
jgi:FMN phosphatase YigB (HAD superfamily)